MAPLVRTGGSRHTGLAALPHRNIHKGKITTKATCTQKGIKTYTCTVCDEIKTEEIPATGKHVNTELRNVKVATCAEEGYTGDIYCKDCNTKLSSGEKNCKESSYMG